MDTRLDAKDKQPSPPTKFNNFLEEKSEVSSHPPDKLKESVKEWERKFLPLQKQAEAEQKEMMSYAKTLVKTCVEDAQNYNFKKALEAYRILEEIIDGREDTTRPFVIKRGRIAHLSPKNGFQKASIYVEKEYRDLLDSVRRQLAALILKENENSYEFLKAARDMIHSIHPTTTDDDRLLATVYNQLSLCYAKAGDNERQQKYATAAISWFDAVDRAYRAEAQQLYVKAKRLEYRNQAQSQKLFEEAEIALNQIRNKNAEDEKIQTECAFHAEKPKAMYANNRNTLMYQIIDGGTVPDEVREKFLNLRIAGKIN